MQFVTKLFQPDTNSDLGRYEALTLDESAQNYPDEQLIDELRRGWEADQDNLETRLQYAIILSKSQSVEDKKEAVIHFELLIYNNFSLRDTLYHLSTLYYSVGDYESARRYSQDLYRLEPDSKQIKTLHLGICYRHGEAMKQGRDEEKKVALTAAGVAVGVLTVGLGLAMSLRKKK